VVVLLDGVLAVTLDVPELDFSVSSWRKDVSSVRWDSTWQDFLGVTVFSESLSWFSSSEVPESERSIPRWGEEIVVVVGQSKITDEVRVTGQAFNRLSEVSGDFGFAIEFPDQDGSVSWSSDEDLSVFVFLLRVSSLDGGDPIAVTLKVSNFSGNDGALFCHHKYYFY